MPRHAAVVSLSLFTCIAAAACNTDAPVNPQQQPSFDIGNPINTGSANPYTLAVIGDIPYGAQKLEDFPKLIALMNADPKVDVAVHLGDIKAGSSSPCTDEYFTTIRGLFDTFQDPLVYTPGDNEWTDCHVASKNNGLYTPTERLAAVRALFFPVPGQTLGGRKKQLLTQADDPDNSAFVENTCSWSRASFSPRSTSPAATTISRRGGRRFRRTLPTTRRRHRRSRAERRPTAPG